ncbi:non-ribosomal peptide synthetase [Pseudonocardia sp. HH130630-07]|uniref:non-ribosomal peptide synthetase n=1 Tax=Pseudonocardia sp. HH130630-07 TaxID=1690815 RepID=UPI00081524F7|nr:non-ribosomal peptide synthetase [Pseudonocardia sp. HH130630-07]ANY07724.1 non-ribosomal peptide synthetase [Pseudonocardia sp. HH130630-07]
MSDDDRLSRAEIRALVAEQLGVGPEEIADDDNLVEFGVHSLRMMKLASAWRRRGYEVTFGDLAQVPSVRGWHELLSGRATVAEPAPAVERSTPDDPTFPLATMQHAYWVGRTDEQELGGVAAHLYAEFDGVGVEPDRLRHAVGRLVERHPMLRSRFLDNGRQEVLDRPGVEVFAVVDLREEDPDTVAARLAELRHTKSHQRMRADRGHVFDVTLTRCPGGRTRLHVDVDMLAADALSYRTLLADLATFYAGDTLPELGYDYRSYLGDHDRAAAVSRERERAWWLERLPDLPAPPELPLVPEGERADPLLTVRYAHPLGAASKQRLLARAREHGVTPAVVLASVFAEVVGRWSRTPRFLLNVPLFDREPLHPDVDLLVGDFSSSIMADVDVSAPGESLVDRARRMQSRLHTAAAHAALPGLDVLRELGRFRGEPLLAPVVYTSGLDLGELFRDTVSSTFGTPVHIISQGPQVVLDAQCVELDGGLLVNWDVREHAFPDGVMAAMYARHRELVEGLLADDPDAWTRPLDDGLPAGQRDGRAVLDGPSVPQSGRRLHDGLLATAEREPERPALLDAEGAVTTYGELRERGLRIAGALAARGVGRGDTVSLQLPKGPDQVAAVLGVFLAGAAYVPVGADQPAARRDRIQAAGAVRLALVADDLLDDQRVPALGFAAALTADPSPEPVATTAADLAYVLFTSGSTGEPKGVEIPHSAAVNTVERCNELFDVGPDDRSLGLSSLEFDLSVQDVWGPLSVGGSVVVPQERDRRDGQRAAALLRAHGVTQLYCVPALLDMLLAAGEEHGLGDRLRTVIVGGDWVGVDLPRRLRALVPRARFAGLGGATETAIHHTVCEVGPQVPDDWAAVPFGVPFGNVAARVVDEAGRDCPDWVAGELWIAGAGLARGYRGDPDRTAERFVEHAGRRWYRTGDLVRFRPEGQVEFLGRCDDQVKIRGYRIEPGEVEAALRAVPGVRAAVVEVVGERTCSLAAAVTVEPGTDLPVDRLRETAGESLPPYMVPRTVVVLDALPLTGNGKIDRRAVRRALLGSDTAPDHVAPEGDLETALAEIVGEVLGVPEVGAETDFFALGGDSVLGTLAVARIREWLDTSDVAVGDLYTGRHVRGLAARLSARQRTPGRLEQVAAVFLEVSRMSDADVHADAVGGS